MKRARFSAEQIIRILKAVKRRRARLQHDRFAQGRVSEPRLELRLRRGSNERWEDASFLNRDR